MSNIHLVYYSLTESPAKSHLDYAETILDASEQQRARKFKAKKAQQQFLLGRLLAKESVASQLGVSPDKVLLSLSENGKPYVKHHPDRHVSISHCEKAVLVATASRNIGVDVEAYWRFENARFDFSDFFSGSVLLDINQKSGVARAQLAAQYWTAIEAVVKLEDSSVFSERKAFDFVLNDQGSYPKKRNIQLHSWATDDNCFASLAVAASDQGEMTEKNSSKLDITHTNYR